MQNGDAFHTFIDDTRHYLASLKLVVYYAEPLPSPTDDRFYQIVSQFLRGTAVQQTQFQQDLAQEQRALLGIYGHRAATLAVRQTSRDWLFSGLIGAVIANHIIPPKRNVEVSLAVYYHCAKKIGEAPAELFDEAAAYAQPELAQKLRNFGHRADIHLKQFGWQEQKTPDGVRYKFDW